MRGFSVSTPLQLLLIIKMPDNIKKRRIEEVVGVDEGEDECKAFDPPENKAMPFTCICYEGAFYTTDEDGFFLHRDSVTKKMRLYRCEINEMKDVVFVFIRSLTDTEALQMENIEDLNIHTDLSKNNRSLYY